MLDRFLQYIKGFDFLKDVAFVVLGGILGIAITWIWQKFQRQRIVRKEKKIIVNTAEKYSDKGIVSLANAYPYYRPSNIILYDSTEQFILGRPDRSDPEGAHAKDVLFQGSTLESLGREMDIPGFAELVEKHRILTEKTIFSNSSGRKLFNNEKFGVRKILLTKTDDKNEDSIIKIWFFKTDYFTHKVMRAVYRELCAAGHPISKCTRIEKLVAYYPFLTSFGIDSLLTITTEDLTEMLVLVKRSKYMANMTEDRWHVSMNEGLSITDIDEITGCISFQKSVSRGYIEELGIRNSSYPMENTFHSVFLGTENLELGITTYARVEMSADDFLLCFKAAEDSAMETTGEYRFLPATRSEVKRFLKSEIAMTDILKYSLEMYLGHL